MDAKPPLAVVDTSILYGNASRRTIVEAIRQGRFEGVWSPHIIGELYRILTIRWIREHGLGDTSLIRLSRASKGMMDVLLAALHLVDTGPGDNEALTGIDDVDDFHLARAARISGADYVVSHNVRDFPKANAQGRHVFENFEFIEYESFLQLIGATKISLLLAS